MHPQVVSPRLDLPGYSDVWRARHDKESIVLDFSCDFHLREFGAFCIIDHRQLISKVFVDRRKTIGQFDPGLAVGSGRNYTVVNILRLRSLGAVVLQVFVLGIERVIDLKALRTCGSCLPVAIQTVATAHVLADHARST